ncbi:uroporphyrinogen decarboxylase [bacterium]|nr:uroporphyrinogen decarboxylase [bacterium]MBU1984654.1 uroporphyrinogen decarboxylase [bacterium]
MKTAHNSLPERIPATTAAESEYLRAARGGKVSPPPVWLMRQAGRYLPEYREIRSRHGFLEVCNTPELACEVTLQPIRRFRFDAAILFSDILLPLIPMGADLSFGKNHGPRISNPLRTRSDVEKLKRFEPRESLTAVLKAIRMIRSELPREIALIGFVGAPFTLASYFIEGGKPDPFANIKRMMYGDPKVFDLLSKRLADMGVEYLAAMVEAGVDAVQLFDTWAGHLSELEFRSRCLPYLKIIFEQLAPLAVPMTYFTLGGMHLLSGIRESGSTVVGLDWRTPIAAARNTLGSDIAIQGNLDPAILLTDETTIRSEVRRIVAEGKQEGHVFNLGHGIFPQTPVTSVEIMLDELRGAKK